MEFRKCLLENLEMNCRFCNTALKQIFADLGESPLANSYLKHADLTQKEQVYFLSTFASKVHDGHQLTSKR